MMLGQRGECTLQSHICVVVCELWFAECLPRILEFLAVGT